MKRVLVLARVTIGAACVTMALAVAQAQAACPNEAVRQEQNKPWLTDCRAYEVVSPQEKAAQDVHSTFSSLRSSADGEKVTYTAFGAFPLPEVKGANWVSRYLATRGSETPGFPWANRSIDSKQTAQLLSFFSLAAGYQNLQTPNSFTPDLSAVVEQNYMVQLDPNLPVEGEVVNLFRRDLADDSYQMLTPSIGPGVNWFFSREPEFVAGTPDLGKILFEDQQKLTPDAGEDASLVKLYEWDHGTIRLVGILPESEGGEPSPSGSVGGAGVAMGQANITAAQRGARPGVMSEDGSRVFFLEGNELTGRLFMREDNGKPGAHTVWISESERTTPESPLPATFWAADPSGTQVTFSTNESLVDGDTDTTADLYRYDLNAPAGERLAQISKGIEPAEFVGVIGGSSDQSHVYFVAKGALTADAPNDTNDKMYLWDSGALTFVTEFEDSESGGLALNWAPGPEPQVSRVSPDGRYALVRSRSRLTGYDNGGHEELYLYDADAPTADAITCASCRPNGTSPTGDESPWNRDPSNNATPYQPRSMVERDGQVRVFFDSEDSVLPQDQNATLDAYEYDSSTGQVSLLSSGTDAAPSYFMDADETGSNVFISTRARLVGWDRDPLYDIYDVRIDGGVAEPTTVPQCGGDECQGPGAAPAAFSAPASTALAGAGNAEPTAKPRKHACPNGKTHSRGKCVKKSLKQHNKRKSKGHGKRNRRTGSTNKGGKR